MPTKIGFGVWLFLAASLFFLNLASRGAESITSAQLGPRLKVMTSLNHVGTILDETRPLRIDIELRNEGTAKLQIFNVSRSCNCFEAKIKTSIIEPGDSTVLRLDISGKGFGERTATILLHTNQADAPTAKLRITYLVETGPVFEQDEIMIGTVSVGTELSRSIAVKGMSSISEPEKVRLQVRSTDPDLRCFLKDDSVAFTVFGSHENRTGKAFVTLEVPVDGSISNKSKKFATLVVRWSVVNESLHLKQASIYLGRLAREVGARTLVQIGDLSGDPPPTLQSITCDFAKITVGNRLLLPENYVGYEIVTTIPSSDSPATDELFKSQATLHFDDGRRLEVELIGVIGD